MEVGTASRFLWNPRRTVGAQASTTRAPLEFHRRLPAYEPTRLVALDALAEEFELSRLWIKDESNRFGLPAFKILGVSWATYRSLVERIGAAPEWDHVGELRRAFSALGDLTLVTATAGNHGRALARVARLFGLGAKIFVPNGAPYDRVAAIAAEGAEVVEARGDYDEAVAEAAAWVTGEDDDDVLLVSDTAVEVGERIPAWISEGYSTMFWEVDDVLRDRDEPDPDAVVVQIGVGSLALAAAVHYRRPKLESSPTIVGVETLSADCLLESARAGEPRDRPGPHRSAMFCLNAGVPSRTSVDGILAGFDAFAAIGDAQVPTSARALAEAGVVAGPTGTAGLVGLREILPQLRERGCERVLLINTEGAADPSGYAEVLMPHPVTA